MHVARRSQEWVRWPRIHRSKQVRTMRRIVCLAFAFAALSAHAASASDNWIIYKGQSASWGYDAGDLGHNQQFGQITATSATYKRRGDSLDGVPYHYAVSTTLLDCTERTVRIKEIALRQRRELGPQTGRKPNRTSRIGDQQRRRPNQQDPLQHRLPRQTGAPGRPRSQRFRRRHAGHEDIRLT
jgi:hypothetical protein